MNKQGIELVKTIPSTVKYTVNFHMIFYKNRGYVILSCMTIYEDKIPLTVPA